MPQSRTQSKQSNPPTPPGSNGPSPIERTFGEVLGSTPAIEGLILLDLKGQVLASAGASKESLAKLAPFGIGILDLVDRLATDAGRGQLDYNLMRAEGGYVMLQQVGPDHIMLALADDDASLGVLLHDVGWCAERLMRHV